MRVGRLQSGGQLLGAFLGVLDGPDEDSDAFLSRGQGYGWGGGASQGLLAGGERGLGGEIDVMPPNFFTLQGGMLMELPEEGARIQTQALTQLSSAQPGGRLQDQGNDGLRQMAMAGKADVAMEPKAMVIKLGQLRQGIEAAIVIEAGQGAPDLEPPADGPDRGFELVLDLGQGEDFFSSPAP